MNAEIRTEKKSRKRKRKGKLELPSGAPQNPEETSSEVFPKEQLVAKKKKRKFKKKKTFKVLGNKMEGSPKRTTTSANYPKDQSAQEGISCNWKRLCQTLSTNKPAGASDITRTPRKPKKTSSPKARRQLQHSSASRGNEIWFDGVDRELLEPRIQSEDTGTSRKENRLVRKGSFDGLTSAVAMDCEMVGTGENGADSILARVSIVNLMGNCIYDKYVKNTEVVTDFRTAVSGIRPSDLENGEDFKVVQKEVSDILEKRILVGHAVHNDLKVLFLTHSKRKIRDTSFYKPFRNLSKGNTPSLKSLAEKLLGVKVQDGEHSSIEDAQAAMRLYTMHKIDWENSIKKKEWKRKNEKAKSLFEAKKQQVSSPTTGKLAQLKI